MSITLDPKTGADIAKLVDPQIGVDYKLVLIVLPIEGPDEAKPVFIADFDPRLLPDFLMHCHEHITGRTATIDGIYDEANGDAQPPDET